MAFVASTITEQIHYEGELVGEERARKRAKQLIKLAEEKANLFEEKAKLDAERARVAESFVLQSIEDLYRCGLISLEVYHAKMTALRKSFENLQNQR